MPNTCGATENEKSVRPKDERTPECSFQSAQTSAESSLPAFPGEPEAPKSYPNKCENKFAKLAHDLGWEATKRGWPDFLCYGSDGQAIAVEVKPYGTGLSRAQQRCMITLASYGMKCFLYDGHVLKPFDPDLPPDSNDLDPIF